MLKKFALFCAKSASVHTNDERIHKCISTIEDYLKGDTSLEKLQIIACGITRVYIDADSATHKATRAVDYASRDIIKS